MDGLESETDTNDGDFTLASNGIRRSNAGNPGRVVNLPPISQIIGQDETVTEHPPNNAVITESGELPVEEPTAVVSLSPISHSNGLVIVGNESLNAQGLTPRSSQTGTSVAGQYPVFTGWSDLPIAERDSVQYTPLDENIVPNEIWTIPSKDPLQGLNKPLQKEELEIRLLRTYRYYVAPWLDLGDLEQTLGMDILQIFNESTIVHEAILKISARRELFVPEHETESRRAPEALNLDLSSPRVYPSPYDVSELAAHWFIALTRLISLQPREWRAIISSNSHILRGLKVQFSDSKVSRAMYWLWLRMGIVPCS